MENMEPIPLQYMGTALSANILLSESRKAPDQSKNSTIDKFTADIGLSVVFQVA
jgi:hypothetical protein